MDGRVSPAAEEANRRLREMRAALAARRVSGAGDSPGDAGVPSSGQAARGRAAAAPRAAALPVSGPGADCLPDSHPVNWPLHNAGKELGQRRAGTRRDNAPTGTAAGAFGEVARGWLALAPTTGDASPGAPGDGDGAPARLATRDLPPGGVGGAGQPPATVTVHPSMLHAILRQDREAAARIWLLLRLADRDGRGWLTVDEARRGLTERDAPLFVCGWRRLRQLLTEGEGVFWAREGRAGGGRLWLRGAHRVAVALECERLQGYPVELPVAALLGGIQGVRAAFYAAFHAGREARPISRATLATLSGVGERTQLAYDRAAHVAPVCNIAIGERYSADNARERAWEHGRAVFRFVDTVGKQGQPGGRYVAWRLPNSYHVGYQRRGRGSRKRLNRKIDDLVTKGIPGNGERTGEPVFHANGARAARQFNRDPERDAYWRQGGRRGGELWGVIAGQRGPIGGRRSWLPPAAGGGMPSEPAMPEAPEALECWLDKGRDTGAAERAAVAAWQVPAAATPLGHALSAPDRRPTDGGGKTRPQIEPSIRPIVAPLHARGPEGDGRLLA